MLLLALLACRDPHALPERGAWVLDAEGVHGELRGEGDCRIGLWGPRFTTGPALVPCQAVPEGDALWLYFPLTSGAGEAEAAARLEGERLVLPLGARAGEFDLTLTRSPGERPDREALAAAAETAVATERGIWEAGRFRLLDGERLVGELSLPADATPEIAVYDPLWMSPGAVDAQRASQGPDILLAFPIMPSFSGEDALIRVNRVTRAVVVPLGQDPHPADRHLRIEPGTVDEAERALATQRALDEGAAREQAVTLPLAQQLAAEAAAKGCAPEVATAEPWTITLKGYRVGLHGDAQDCELWIAPQTVQHGRRVKARVGPEGVRELVVMPVG